MRRAMTAAALAAALLSGAFSLSGCVLDNMWSESAREDCDRDSSAGGRLNCHDRVDQIERERDQRNRN